MKSPIEFMYPTGQNVYAIIHNPVDNSVWNFVDSAWNGFTQGDWASYAVPLTEQGTTGYYRAAYPADIGEILTTEAIYLRGGATPAADDTGLSIGQSQGTNVAAVANDGEAAANLGRSAGAMARGAALAGTLSETQALTDLASTIVDAFIGRTIVWTSGNVKDEAARITAYDGAGLITFEPLTDAPAADDTFVIV